MNIPLTFPVSLSDGAFDASDARNYGLAVIAGEAEFSCAVLDFRKNRFIGLHHGLSSAGESVRAKSSEGDPFAASFLGSIRETIPWIQAPFRLARIAYSNKSSTLVPAPLYDSAEKMELFRFNHPSDPGEPVHADHLMPLDAWQLYPLPTRMEEPLRILFPGQKIVHISGLFIESVWINYKNRLAEPCAFLHLRGSLFDLMVFDGREMIYFNTFSFDSPEEVAYYLIFVLEQLEFNPDTLPLILYGPVDYGDALWTLLTRYIRHVRFGQRNEAYGYCQGIANLPEHRFFPLLNFFSCGL
ncbi:MAG TPA: DUF3822 family protein [Bacteroidales bacterium]|nr:DUF3822 family protein [Bacteroidales bacterium]HPS61562.1 DUF3822 family protein [Bacteroidales bacterium]